MNLRACGVVMRYELRLTLLGLDFTFGSCSKGMGTALDFPPGVRVKSH